MLHQTYQSYWSPVIIVKVVVVRKIAVIYATTSAIYSIQQK